MMKRLSLLIAFSLFASLPAAAGDCGQPPLDKPAIPNGATATTEHIRQARDAVVAYSEKVDKYLSCMDTWGQKIMPFMTKDQKARWAEDLASLHNGRRNLQIKMNDAIRAYRDAHVHEEDGGK